MRHELREPDNDHRGVRTVTRSVSQHCLYISKYPSILFLTKKALVISRMKVFILLTLAVLLMVSTDVAIAGFGCPLNKYQCNEHCQSISCRAGYCEYLFRCTCTGCKGKK
uniref:Invertebrate defensins family profile domain-containing protein n=1 Tax=Magallana gigas TaxID=29159 RepID=A0A8W8M7R5_MAGGI